ncbi:Mu transposase C-terminal domain-containing protein [Saccharopolyspora shandongensis]|uniref:Mu transposase C-terminal domain-containing protein n=1 Tax=Saccharopolyspora shandongensis TaxID=418495 RepID=UPI003432CA01
MRVLRLGQKLSVDQRVYRVESVGGAHVVLRELATGEVTAWQTNALLTDPRVCFGGVDQMRLCSAEIFEWLPEAAREAALEWQEDVCQAAAQCRSVREADETVAGWRCARGQPTTVRHARWMRQRYRRFGAWGLVDQRRLGRRRRRHSDDPRVREVLDQLLKAQARRSTVTKSAVIARAKLELARDGGLPRWSRATWYRVLDEVQQARQEHRYAFGMADTRRSHRAKPSGQYRVSQVVRPGARVLFDVHRLDVRAILPGGKVGSVDVVAALDVATRSIPAAVLRPRGAKAVDAAVLLAQCATPLPARPGWPQALRLSHALAHGQDLTAVDARLAAAAACPVIMPATVVVDHDKIYAESAAFRSAAAELSINVEWARPFTPTDKAVLERAFGTVRTQFSQFLAGFTGGRVAMRGDDVDSHARWTLEQLQDVFEEWVVTIYQRRAHAGLRSVFGGDVDLSPNDVYDLAVAYAGYVPLPLTAEQFVRLLPIQRRRITHEGIRWNNRTYNCDELTELAKAPGPRDQRWPVHVNPYDLRQVWVIDPTGERVITVPWVYAGLVDQPFTAEMYTQAHQRALQRRAGHAQERDDAVELQAGLLQHLVDGPAPMLTPEHISLPRTRVPEDSAASQRQRARQALRHPARVMRPWEDETENGRRDAGDDRPG